MFYKDGCEEKITMFYVLALVTTTTALLAFWPSFCKKAPPRSFSKNVAMEKGIRNSKTNIAAFLVSSDSKLLLLGLN